MKTRDIAEKFGIDQKDFENYLVINKVEYKNKFSGFELEKDVEFHVERFIEYNADQKLEAALKEMEEVKRQEKLKEEKLQKEKYEEEKRIALANMLITSGFNFDGYVIKKYSGYISGDDVVQISRGVDGIFSRAADVGKNLTDSLTRIRRNAIKELKEAAFELGCNAVVGVDFDYITLEPETANSRGGTTYLPYVFCVTANGNAVVIEKTED